MIGWIIEGDEVPAIGSVLRGEMSGGDGDSPTPCPFVVIGSATADEFRNQVRRYVDPLEGHCLAFFCARHAVAFLKLVAE